MDWIRENKVLAAILGFIVAGGIALGVFLVMGFLSYSSSLEQFQTLDNSVAGLKGAKLFPSKENVDAKDAAVSEYESAVDKLGNVLLVLQPKVEPMSEIEFQEKLKKRIAETKDQAAAQIPAVVLPNDFAFGFPDYTAKLPISAEAAKELGGYLNAVDSVVNLMVTAGVDSIDTLERSELSVEKGAPPPPPPPSKESKSKSKAKKSDTKASQKKEVEVAKVLERRQLTVALTTDQGALQTVLNGLASASEMKSFTIVRNLRIENVKQEGPLRSAVTLPQDPIIDTPAPGPGGDATGTDKPAPEVLKAATPAKEDSVAVMGQEKLKVYMEIDIVRFVEPEA